jgi:N utilization substance protein A
VRTVIGPDQELENYQAQLTLEQARQYLSDPKPGDTIVDEVPPVDMGRIAAQSAKQVILQKVREAERDRQFEEFKDRIGTIINGVVKREEYGNVIVDIGRGEGILRRNEKIGRESYRPNDRIRCFIKDVRRETRGPQVFLSRTDPQFMAELFKMEVPEIYDGIIEIKAVARDPGSRAKIAVISYDNSIDPVGACVGMRGSRVQAVVNELQGEKIDIIPWNQDAATFLVNALQPAEVAKVVIDEEAGKIEVVVPDEQLSLAIGRRGQNVRLASQLTGLDIDIMTEAEESERRQAEFAERTKLFMDTLDLDEFFAQLLVSEGFTSLEEVAYVDLDELLVIEGVDESTAQELQARARDHIEAQNKAALDHARALGVEDSLIEFEGLTPQMIEALGVEGIKTLEDFATCADWELAGGWTTENGERKKDDGILEKFEMSLEEAQNLVMTARIQLGWVDPADLEQTAEETEAEEEEA